MPPDTISTATLTPHHLVQAIEAADARRHRLDTPGAPLTTTNVRLALEELCGGRALKPAAWQALIDAAVEAGLVVADGLTLQRVQPKLEQEPTPLPNGERAPLDAYYTPLKHTRACVRWLAERVLPTLPAPLHGNGHDTAVECAVGGGNWVLAMHELLPSWTVDRVDINPNAAGLALDLRDREDTHTADWLAPFVKQPHPTKSEHHPLRRWYWRLCLGNQPYGEDLVGWFERSIERADCVSLLLRETATGSEERLEWWMGHRPAWICKVMPRPKWEGPGHRDTSDRSDTVLVTWVRGVTETRWDWIDAREGA